MQERGRALRERVVQLYRPLLRCTPCSQVSDHITARSHSHDDVEHISALCTSASRLSGVGMFGSFPGQEQHGPQSVPGGLVTLRSFATG